MLSVNYVTYVTKCDTIENIVGISQAKGRSLAEPTM